MADASRKIPVAFYSTPGGAELVRDWLRGLDPVERNIIGQDLMRLQFRWPVGMPLCRPMRHGIWEWRSSLPGNRIARILFGFIDGRLVALHGFIKKTEKTPSADLDLAHRRKREFRGQEL